MKECERTPARDQESTFGAWILAACKPDPAIYQVLAHVFDVTPCEVMLVAAHVDRPLEHSHAKQQDVSAKPDNTFMRRM